jgi:adenine-specific DNA-methyltransferase
MHNHEYVVCYAHSRDLVRFRGLDRELSDFVNPDGDPRGLWRSESMKATGTRNNYFTIVDPVSGFGYHANWAFTPASIDRMVTDGLVLFPPAGDGVPRQKKFMDSYTFATKATVTSLGWHSTEKATKQLMDLFDGEKAFSFPKPLSLIEFFCDQLLHPGDLVVDFFAGSGTTGHAVMNINAMSNPDGTASDRRFLLVQLPEALDAASRDQRTAAAVCDRLAKPRTIAELTKERLRRAGLKVRRDNPGYAGDVGFRVYQLGSDANSPS